MSLKESGMGRAIVTGGTEGIGRAIALELANQGHGVVICARTQEMLNKMRDGSRVEIYRLDLADTEKIADFIKQGSERLGGITVLILNAAVSGNREPEDYTLKVNRDAQKALVESAAHLLRLSNGRIVFLSSPQARNIVEDNRVYGQSKKEVEEWLREFSMREGNQGINIFSVNPGPVDTRMHDEAIGYGGEITRDRSMQFRSKDQLRDPKIVGRIIAKMAVGGKKFNQETGLYDIPIGNNEIVKITDENIEFEKNNEAIVFG